MYSFKIGGGEFLTTEGAELQIDMQTAPFVFCS